MDSYHYVISDAANLGSAPEIWLQGEKTATKTNLVVESPLSNWPPSDISLLSMQQQIPIQFPFH